MAADSATSPDDLQRLYDAQRAAFSFASVPPVRERKKMLARLEGLIADWKERIVEAIDSDFGGRSHVEILSAEIAMTASHTRHLRKHLDAWTRTRRVWNHAPIPGRASVTRQAKGVVGVIAPWNYPFQLAAIPAITALAAGNRVMLKPSEITPHTAELLRAMFAEACGEEELAIITGGPDIAEAFTALPFDHLFYTGSTAIGRKVALAAARNLTPVTLELGGKSPALILPDAPMARSATTLAMGKFYNGGQTCVAPDYLLVPAGSGKAWADALMGAVAESLPDIETNPDYTAIISERHYARMEALIEEARAGGGIVIQPPHNAAAMRKARRIAPTIILDPPAEASIMKEEIFGPVLPIIEKPDTEEMIVHVTARDHPLALYVYSADRRAVERVLAQTTSGGVCVNGTILHLAIEDLPFGGVGKSGYGAYHGERGFAEFSHERARLDLPGWLPARLLAPPWSSAYRWLIDRQIGR